MIVTESGRSGLTNAYRSVLSATGSFEISGASRWDDMAHLTGAGARTVEAGNAWRGKAAASGNGAYELAGDARVLDGQFPVAHVHGDLARVGVDHMGDDGVRHVDGLIVLGADGGCPEHLGSEGNGGGN